LVRQGVGVETVAGADQDPLLVLFGDGQTYSKPVSQAESNADGTGRKRLKERERTASKNHRVSAD
jgi:hypothetical protein